MQVRNKILMLAVFSKACALTWKGELVQSFFLKRLLGPLLQRKYCSCLYCESQTR